MMKCLCVDRSIQKRKAGRGIILHAFLGFRLSLLQSLLPMNILLSKMWLTSLCEFLKRELLIHRINANSVLFKIRTSLFNGEVIVSEMSSRNRMSFLKAWHISPLPVRGVWALWYTALKRSALWTQSTGRYEDLTPIPCVSSVTLMQVQLNWSLDQLLTRIIPALELFTLVPWKLWIMSVKAVFTVTRHPTASCSFVYLH